jgi:hemoglobin-like flavoprotein
MNADRLRASFQLVVEKEPLVFERFYDILFARRPTVRRLFRSHGRTAQAEMLTRALVSVLDRLEDAAWLEETLGGLGSKHVAYGVTDEMYEWVGEALLATLEEVAGPDWTPDVAADWSEVYGEIAALMKKGSSPVAA